MEIKNPQWRGYYRLMGDVDLERPWEDKIIRKTMGGAVQKRRYEERAKVIVELLNTGDSILEIGCGYGGLARETLKRKSVSYTVVENEEMLILAKRFLGDGVEYIDAAEIETLQGRKFDLFIADFCLTETPAEYRKYVFENIAKNCQRISILENDLFNIEKDIRKYFTIEKTKWSGHLRRWEYAGERCKDIV